MMGTDETKYIIYSLYEQNVIYCIKKNSRFTLEEILITIKDFYYSSIVNINTYDP